MPDNEEVKQMAETAGTSCSSHPAGSGASAVDLRSMTLQELTQLMLGWGEKSYRAQQIFSWIHGKLAADIDAMSDLPQSLRERLTRETVLCSLVPVEILTSKTDGTQKFLFQLSDGNVIESVLMRYHHGNSVCVSSQCGCRMGCTFCASTIGGRVRDLSAGEILEQIYRIQAITGERVSHVVMMGSGEPLDNYDQVIRFLRLISHEKGLNISLRNITVSTCGLVDGIRRLAGEHFPITLALSLHAANQEKRSVLMPIARKYPLGMVLDACRYYTEVTGRRMTFEYSLVAGVNDTFQDAKELAMLLKDLHGHINLIPVNPVEERSYRQPQRKAVLEFQKQLEKYGMNVTIRREMGRDISGACGQLRRSYLADRKPDRVNTTAFVSESHRRLS